MIIGPLENPVKWQTRPFQDADQEAASALILAGLAERWGVCDPTLNPDLRDIHAHYIATGGAFVVVAEGEEIIGTGGLILELPGVGRIVRVSVAATQRRRGLGRAITLRLINEGRQRGCHAILVETNDDWHSAVRLYESCGFVPFSSQDGEIHMRLVL